VDLILESRSPEQTRTIGATLSNLLRPGDVVLLHGDLGAGKTTLVQGVVNGFGIDELARSPTFSLISEYPVVHPASGSLDLRHVDLYRIDDPAELDDLGFADLVNVADAITLIEWPERAIEALPAAYLLIELTATGENDRQIRFRAFPHDGLHVETISSLRGVAAD
jgi:tRNA threonylcarbamoyladenosine biosynthesis protein TsaE